MKNRVAFIRPITSKSKAGNALRVKGNSGKALIVKSKPDNGGLKSLKIVSKLVSQSYLKNNKNQIFTKKLICMFCFPHLIFAVKVSLISQYGTVKYFVILYKKDNALII